MASKKDAITSQFGEEPPWPTTMRTRLTDGRLVGTDNSVWVYREVPLGPVVDASSPAESLNVAMPLMAALDELAAMTGGSMQRRSVAKSGYREIHILLVNVPQEYTPPRNHPIAGYLRQSFGHIPVDRRVLLLGVRLQANVGGDGGIKDMIDSVVETLASGGTPMSDYDKDFKKVDAAMTRAGLFPASSESLHVANAWWNTGRNPDTPLLVHDDHLHFFSTVDAVRQADKAGVSDCRTWDERGIKGQNSATFACVEDLDLPFIEPTSPQATWVSDLLDADAIAVSIRGQIEPSKVTRNELRRQKKRYIDDINERQQNNKMARGEQEEMLARLGAVENFYATGGTPTLAGTSIVVALDGQVEDLSQALWQHSPARLASMQFRQPAAFAEMMLCSGVRANPNLHDLPVQAIAFSGLPSLSFVGDRNKEGDGDGAQLGFTQRDRQPAFLSPTAASAIDSLPLALCAGSTGSGKTMLLLNLADQYTRMGNPVVIIDPKLLSLDTPIPTPDGWKKNGDIKVGDKVFDRHGNPCNVTALSPLFEEPDLYEVVLDDGQVIKADAQHRWVVADSRGRMVLNGTPTINEDRLRRLEQERNALGDAAASFSDSDLLTSAEIKSVLDASGVKRWVSRNRVVEALANKGVRAERKDGRENFYPAVLSFKALMSYIESDLDAGGLGILRDVTTADMMSEGLKTTTGRGAITKFAIPVSSAIQMPEADLPIDPYVMGVWLGDGTSKSGDIASVDPEVLDEIRAAGFEVNTSKTNPAAHHVRGLIPGLREAGVLGNKHIPAQYLFASEKQRMALLQGLMDTDGTVEVKKKALRLTVCNESLARDFLELVRGLGMKATFWSGPSRLCEDDPDSPGRKRSRIVGTEYVITFYTDRTVFRLPRKAELDTTPSPRAGWLYIKDIRKVKTEPGRCIRVDSPDHTYLAAGFVPTHNTGSDHSAVVLAAGGQVASLDDLTKADGVFDPIRFSATKDVGVELATSMLMSINPWGTRKDDMEVPLQHALHHGVTRGAECIGQALKIAESEIPDLPQGMIQSVFNLVGSSPMFSACVGMNPSTEGLRAAHGITLIKVGDAHLDLPEPGVAPTGVTQRIALALVRMMVFGSAMALTNRQGVVMLDEAWVFLGAGATEVQRLGRLARSQQVLPMLFTQRVSDAIEAKLEGYISRGIILPIEDREEAHAACRLFKLEATPERMAKITAKGTISGSNTAAVVPNWDSMRALRDPQTGEVLRGSIAIYADIHGRAIPVEIALSREFLELALTNPEDIRRRLAERKARGL